MCFFLFCRFEISERTSYIRSPFVVSVGSFPVHKFSFESSHFTATFASATAACYARYNSALVWSAKIYDWLWKRYHRTRWTILYFRNNLRRINLKEIIPSVVGDQNSWLCIFVWRLNNEIGPRSISLILKIGYGRGFEVRKQKNLILRRASKF